MLTFENLLELESLASTHKGDPKAQVEKLKAGAHKALQQDVYVRAFGASVQSLGGIPRKVRSPLDVLGEQRAYAYTLMGRPESTLFAEATSADEQALISAKLGLEVLMATPYLWLDEMRLAISSDFKLPEISVQMHDLPHPVMWWTFEGSIDAKADHPEALPDTVEAILLRAYTTGVAVYQVGTVGNHPSPVVTSGFHKFGKVYKIDTPAGQSTALLAAMLAFINSPYIDKSPVKAPRQIRRAAAKSGFKEAPEVRLVKLRRPLSNGATKLGTDEPQDWQYRWMVSGHFRRQWYPSEKLHRTVWIAPYVKGPEDKPMKQTVFRVER